MLPSVRAVVHSGGLNVAHAALYARTPQLLLPTVLEQRLTGEAIRSAGAGAYLPPRGMDAFAIRSAIERLVRLPALDAPSFRDDPGERTLAILERTVTRMARV